MGLGKQLLEIEPRDIKKARKIMEALLVLGISENDLLEIKSLPAIKKELAELQSYVANVQLANRNNKQNELDELDSFSIKKAIEAYTGSVEEFNPNGKSKE